MTDDEADELFNRLTNELRAKRDKEQPIERDDFLKAIEADINTGKPVPVTLKVSSEKTFHDPIAGRRRTEGTSSGEFIQRQEYTAKEKLGILINGLALAIAAPPLMAQTFISEMSRLSDNVKSGGVRLGDDQTTDPLQSLQISSIDEAVQATTHLRTLLDEIHRELSADTEATTASGSV